MTSPELCSSSPPDFRFVRNRLGLAGGQSLQLGSPFSYREQARLHIARARQAADLGQTTLVESLVMHALSLSPRCLQPGDPLLTFLRPGLKKRNLFGFLRRPG